MTQSADEILVTNTKALFGWHIHSLCRACRSTSLFVIADLAEKFHSLTVAELLGHLQCRFCRLGEHSRVEIRNQKTHVVLVGDERSNL